MEQKRPKILAELLKGLKYFHIDEYRRKIRKFIKSIKIVFNSICKFYFSSQFL